MYPSFPLENSCQAPFISPVFVIFKLKITCPILPSFLPLFKLKFFIVYDFIVFYENS